MLQSTSWNQWPTVFTEKFNLDATGTVNLNFEITDLIQVTWTNLLCLRKYSWWVRILHLAQNFPHLLTLQKGGKCWLQNNTKFSDRIIVQSLVNNNVTVRLECCIKCYVSRIRISRGWIINSPFTMKIIVWIAIKLVRFGTVTSILSEALKRLDSPFRVLNPNLEKLFQTLQCFIAL